ncbi:MAG: hypothetical protein J0G94_16805 [Sphingomonadales bacterium]|nr:hypothetical protein [Sphingomonadales bacterium]
MAQGSKDEALRRLLPLTLLLFALNSFRFVIDSAPGVGDVAHLRAIALPLGRLIGWIAGASEPGLLPEPLRTAPLPLLVDWLLWRLDPVGIAGLHGAHLLLALGALALLLRALAMRIDARAAMVAGFVIALSPRFVEPIMSLGPDPCGITGMLSSASLFAALIHAAPDRVALRRRALAALPVLALWAVPLTAQILAPPTATWVTSFDLARLGLKLLAHNADLLQLPGAALLVGGTAVLIGVGAYGYAMRRLRNGSSERTHPFALLLMAALVGTALVLIAGPLLRLYLWVDPAAQSWLALLLVLLAAACFTPRLVQSSGLQRIRRFAAGAMIAGAVAGAIAFQYRADWFAAGPEAGLQRALQSAGRNRAIVYASFDWGRAYYPHAWMAPDDGNQWLLSVDAGSVQRVLDGGQLGQPEPLSALDGYDTLVIARIDRRGWRDLNAVTNMDVIGALPPAPIDQFPGLWIAEPARAAPGEYWLTTQLLRKTE